MLRPVAREPEYVNGLPVSVLPVGIGISVHPIMLRRSSLHRLGTAAPDLRTPLSDRITQMDDLQFKQLLETLQRIAEAIERTATATETLARGADVKFLSVAKSEE